MGTGAGGLSLPGGGGGFDRALRPDPPPKKAHLTGPPKSYRDRPTGLGGDPDPKMGKKMKMGFLESARRGGSEKSSFAMDLVEKKLTNFNVQKNFHND